MKPYPPLEQRSPLITVAAAVIERKGRVLLGRRPFDKRHGGLWEFPGGKLAAGETLGEALGRELREELGLELERVGAVLFHSRDLDAPFDVCFVEVLARGTPRALEHVELEWCDRSRFMGLDLAPADRRFVVERLAAHGHSAVT